MSEIGAKSLASASIASSIAASFQIAANQRLPRRPWRASGRGHAAIGDARRKDAASVFRYLDMERAEHGRDVLVPALGHLVDADRARPDSARGR